MMKKSLAPFAFVFLILSGVTFHAEAEVPAQIQLTSPAFQSGSEIPQECTCEGRDVSPPLVWKEIPKKSQSLVLIMDDPDVPAGTWVHWVIFNLPPTIHSLPKGMPALKQLANGEMHGMNSFGRYGYRGPCPPSGSHRYFFKLYALDIPLQERERMTKEEVEKAMEGHVLAKGELMGTYAKKK